MTNPLSTDGEVQITLRHPEPKTRAGRGTRFGELIRLIEFEVPAEDWDLFADDSLNRIGMVLEATMRVTHRQGAAQPASQPTPEKPYGKMASELYRLGFFNVLDVLAAIGTDAQYAEWIQMQPCAACGGGDLAEHTGELMCEAAHYRTAANSGGAIKPPFSYMPLCHEHHIHVQHQHGISTLHAVYLSRTGGHTTENYVQAAKDWAEKRTAHYRALWGGKTLAYILGCATSMGYVAPETLREWAVGMGLEKYLPSAYLEGP